jgi:hypothetical protein
MGAKETKTYRTAQQPIRVNQQGKVFRICHCRDVRKSSSHRSVKYGVKAAIFKTSRTKGAISKHIGRPKSPRLVEGRIRSIIPIWERQRWVDGLQRHFKHSHYCEMGNRETRSLTSNVKEGGGLETHTETKHIHILSQIHKKDTTNEKPTPNPTIYLVPMITRLRPAKI